MTNRKTTRRALFMSIISLMLCCAMLVGTTFAWFTDSVTSLNNVITAGNLDVELYHSDKADTNEEVNSTIKLFDDVTLWEPGAVVYENLVVKNAGNLALKYQMALNFDSANATKTPNGYTLADVLKVAVVPGGFTGGREEAKNLAYNYTLSTFALEGKLVSGASSDTYGIVIYWAPGANDNEFNMNNNKGAALTIDLGINLFATQLEAESDSFGDDYDAGADSLIPEVESTFGNVNTDGSASFDAPVAPSTTTDKTTIEAPAGAFEPTDKVEVEVETTNTLFNVTANGAVVASLDVTMTVNGQETSADLTEGAYTVTTYIPKGLTDVSVTYTGTDGKAQPTGVDYDPNTGKLTFQTTHFSEYAVSGKALAYDAATDTALTDIKDIVDESKKEGSTVVIPEANQDKIKEEIKTLPDDKQEDAAAALAAAKIGEKTYATLTDAFANVQSGETIDLLNNVKVGAGIVIAAGKTVTLNLNGYTVSGSFENVSNANKTLIDVKGTLTVNGKGTITMNTTGINMGWNAMACTICVNGGDLTVNNATIMNEGGTDMSYALDTNPWNPENNQVLDVVLNNATIESTQYRGVRVRDNGPYLVKFVANDSKIDEIWYQEYSSGNNNNTGNYGVLVEVHLNNTTADTSRVQEPGVLFINGKTTVSTAAELKTAIKNIPDGGQIVLSGNVIFDQDTATSSGDGWYEGLYYVGDKSFTIDLGGNTISNDSAVNDYLMLFKNDGQKPNTITIKNGTLEATSSAYCALCTSTTSTQKITINLESVNLIGNNSGGAVAKIRGGSELNVKSGTVITGNDSYLGIEAAGNNTVVNIYEGAKIYQKGKSSYCACLIGASGKATVNVFGGYGKSAKGAFIAMTSGGTFNISGGEWIANTDGTYANDNASVLIAQSAKGAQSTVNVTGGTFKGGYNCYGDAVGDAEIIISGGNFNSDPAAYVIDGYKAVAVNDEYQVVANG